MAVVHSAFTTWSLHRPSPEYRRSYGPAPGHSPTSSHAVDRSSSVFLSLSLSPLLINHITNSQSSLFAILGSLSLFPLGSGSLMIWAGKRDSQPLDCTSSPLTKRALWYTIPRMFFARSLRLIIFWSCGTFNILHHIYTTHYIIA